MRIDILIGGQNTLIRGLDYVNQSFEHPLKYSKVKETMIRTGILVVKQNVLCYYSILSKDI